MNRKWIYSLLLIVFALGSNIIQTPYEYSNINARNTPQSAISTPFPIQWELVSKNTTFGQDRLWNPESIRYKDDVNDTIQTGIENSEAYILGGDPEGFLPENSAAGYFSNPSSIADALRDSSGYIQTYSGLGGRFIGFTGIEEPIWKIKIHYHVESSTGLKFRAYIETNDNNPDGYWTEWIEPGGIITMDINGNLKYTYSSNVQIWEISSNSANEYISKIEILGEEDENEYVRYNLLSIQYFPIYYRVDTIYSFKFSENLNVSANDYFTILSTYYPSCLLEYSARIDQNWISLPTLTILSITEILENNNYTLDLRISAVFGSYDTFKLDAIEFRLGECIDPQISTDFNKGGLITPEITCQVTDFHLNHSAVWFYSNSSILHRFTLDHVENNTGFYKFTKFCDGWDIWESEWNSYGDKTHLLNFATKDMCDNLNIITRQVQKESSLPNITVISPFNNSIVNDEPPTIQFSVTDENLLKESIHFYLSGQIFFPEIYGNSCYFNDTLSSDWEFYKSKWGNGQHQIIIQAEDSFGNQAESRLNIVRDTQAPLIIPQGIFCYIIAISNHITPNLLATAEDNIALDEVCISCSNLTLELEHYNDNWFGLDSFSEKWNEWNSLYQSLEEGPHTFLFYANDTNGYSNNISCILLKDTVAPSISDIPISNYSQYGETSPGFEWNITEVTSLVCCIQYSVNNSDWFTICEIPDPGLNIGEIHIVQEQFTIPEWNNLPDGILNITIRTGDSAYNYRRLSYLIIKDTNGPIFTLELDTSIFYETAPTLNYSLHDLTDVESVIVSFDSGENNYTYSLETWQQIWNFVEYNESILLTFYIRDSLGNVGTYSTIISKRDSTPVLTVIEPSNSMIASSPPNIIYSVQGECVDTVWYELDKMVGLVELDGNSTLAEQLWDQMNFGGEYTLTIYANSTHGQVASVDIIIFKSEEVRDGLLALDTPRSIYFVSFFSVGAVIGIIVFVKKIRRENSVV